VRRRPRRRAATRNGDAVWCEPRHVRADRELQVGPSACPGDPGAPRAMSSSGVTLATAPLLPWAYIGLLGTACALVLGFGILRRAPGLPWRDGGLGILRHALRDPL